MARCSEEVTTAFMGINIDLAPRDAKVETMSHSAAIAATLPTSAGRMTQRPKTVKEHREMLRDGKHLRVRIVGQLGRALRCSGNCNRRAQIVDNAIEHFPEE